MTRLTVTLFILQEIIQITTAVRKSMEAMKEVYELKENYLILTLK